MAESRRELVVRELLTAADQWRDNNLRSVSTAPPTSVPPTTPISPIQNSVFSPGLDVPPSPMLPAGLEGSTQSNKVDNELVESLREYFKTESNYHENLIVIIKLLNNIKEAYPSRINPHHMKFIEDYSALSESTLKLSDNVNKELLKMLKDNPSPMIVIARIKELFSSPLYNEYSKATIDMALRYKEMNAILMTQALKAESLQERSMVEELIQLLPTEDQRLGVYNVFVKLVQYFTQRFMPLGNVEKFTSRKLGADASEVQDAKFLFGKAAEATTVLNERQRIQDTIRTDDNDKLIEERIEGAKSGLTPVLASMLVAATRAFTLPEHYLDEERAKFFDRHLHNLFSLMPESEQYNFTSIRGIFEALGITPPQGKAEKFLGKYELANVQFNPSNFDGVKLGDLYKTTGNPIFLVLKCMASIKEGFNAQDKVQAYLTLAEVCKAGGLSKVKSYMLVAQVVEAAVAFAQSCESEIKEQVNKKFIASSAFRNSFATYAFSEAKAAKDKPTMIIMKDLIKGQRSSSVMSETSPSRSVNLGPRLSSAPAGGRALAGVEEENPNGTTRRPRLSISAPSGEGSPSQRSPSSPREVLTSPSSMPSASARAMSPTQHLKERLQAVSLESQTGLEHEIQRLGDRIRRTYQLKEVKDVADVENMIVAFEQTPLCQKLIDQHGEDQVKYKLEELCNEIKNEWGLDTGKDYV